MSRIVCIKLHRDDAERLISALEDAAANAEELAAHARVAEAGTLWTEDSEQLDRLARKIRAAVEGGAA